MPSTLFKMQQVQNAPHVLPPATRALLCGLAHQLQVGYWSEHGPGLHVVSIHPTCGPYKVWVKF
jgi:hypothetical protein